MPDFDYALSPVEVSPDLCAAHREAWIRIASPGSWWTGAQRVEAARLARVARAGRNEPPWHRETPVSDPDLLPERFSLDPDLVAFGRLPKRSHRLTLRFVLGPGFGGVCAAAKTQPPTHTQVRFGIRIRDPLSENITTSIFWKLTLNSKNVFSYT